MENRPFILVTNDDGIGAKGIRSLVEVAKEFGDVLVVAPDKPQSGMGHAITVNDTLRLNKASYIREYEGLDAYSCSGTPVDCVKLAIYQICKQKRPDFILSGINHGANYSTNVLYSGTMSAAIEGALEGIPSVGFSLLNHDADADFAGSQRIVRRVLELITEHKLRDGICLNVNIPDIKAEEIKGLKVCRQGKASWEDTFDHRKDPHGKDYFWLTGEFKSKDHGTDTDIWALDQQFASMVPTQFDLTAYHAMADLNSWNL